jgi:hypothetical protein
MSPRDQAAREVARSVFVLLTAHANHGETPESKAAAREMRDRLMANKPLTELRLNFSNPNHENHTPTE